MNALFLEHFPAFVLEQAEERGFQASVLQPLSSNFGCDLTGDPSLLLSDDFPRLRVPMFPRNRMRLTMTTRPSAGPCN